VIFLFGALVYSGSQLPSAAGPSSPEDLAALEKKIQAVYEKVSKSTVALFADEEGRGRTLKGGVKERPTPKGRHIGSGTLITKEGHILTHAHHDFAPGAKVRVVLGDGRKATGKFLGVHGPHDLSLVKLDGEGPWPAVPLGEPAKLKRGENCLELGWPGTYYRDGRPPLLRLGRFLGSSTHHLFSSCVIRGGDSGGPLVNLDGELIGVSDFSPNEQHGTGHVSVAVYLQIHKDLLQSKFVDESILRIGPLKGDLTGRGPFKDTKGLGTLGKSIRPSVVVVLSPDQPVALGLVVGADGWILTRASELEDRVLCQLADGRRLKASVAGKSEEHDLALLKVAATDLPVVAWSDRPLKPGVLVASVGPEPHPLVFGAVASPVLKVPLYKGGRLPFDVQAPEPAADIPGVQITDVWQGEPTRKEVVQDYDLLTHVEGTPVPTMKEYQRVTKPLLAKAVAGERVQLTIQRGDKTLKVKVSIECDFVTSGSYRYLGGRRGGFPAAFLHDAWVSRSHNGSPVVDVEGKVIGINLATESVGLLRAREPGLMHAIPADVVRKLVEQLRKSAKR
jgi:S1-C subfamily serine protease